MGSCILISAILVNVLFFHMVDYFRIPKYWQLTINVISHATNIFKWMIIFLLDFCSFVLFCFLLKESGKEKQLLVNWGVGVVWDTGHFMAQRNSRWGDSTPSQPLSLTLGMWCAPGECWEATCEAILRGVWNFERRVPQNSFSFLTMYYSSEGYSVGKSKD